VLYLSDVHSLGLKAAQGLQFTESFYWDLNEGTRAFAKRFAPRNNGRYPTAIQAGVYAETLHYLKAVDELGASSDGKAVVREMKKLPTDDPLFGKGTVRADGRKLHNMYLFEVKKPDESKYPWDYYKLIQTIPPSEPCDTFNHAADACHHRDTRGRERTTSQITHHKSQMDCRFEWMRSFANQ